MTLGVALIGVPHGALDPLFGKRLLRRFGKSWRVFFFGAYLLVAAAVVSNWYLAPVAACLLFFALSAWHFGLEEDYVAPVKSPFLRQILAVSRGSLIILAVVINASSQKPPKRLILREAENQ